ncbi:hypothetical protein BDF20DRAFT_530332 [Mycotypha africana]|uniref:uncharacterized protein n=1 Tax=Mycotypha africana TaxID=64632 RepID=UPI0023019A63|nr:uncharacterized protein BDF20DRAFT_530332 [Mycotypha africana]KAI8979767.1 hypothetical protein BDF20DRAFT_530332 [Mycotypha africana]
MPSDITYKDILLYKTESCRNWDEKGSCRYGKRCRYAHGKEELRPILRSNQYKTKICKAYHDYGTCSYGVRCTFIHNDVTGATGKEDDHYSRGNIQQSSNVGCVLPSKEDSNNAGSGNSGNNVIHNFISKNVWDSMLDLSSYEPAEQSNHDQASYNYH